MKYSTTVAAETVASGQTLDSLVKMPSGPEAKLAVYEPAMHLDNNGQRTSSPQQFAFGGMLTFLDTNAPPPSTDGVGPVSTHVSVTPNPSDARADVTVTADLSDVTTGGSGVDQAEFVVDDAVVTGVGWGTAMTAANYGTISVTGATATIPAGVGGSCDPVADVVPLTLNCLSAGKHTIFVRAHDTSGNWGAIGSVIFNMPKTGPQTTGGTLSPNPANGSLALALSATGDDSNAGGKITDAEYFIDTAGANGTGATMTRNQTATVVSLDGTVPAATVAALAEGTHHLLVHAEDSLNLWGPVLDVPLIVDQTGPLVDAAAVGPNPSNGVRTDKGNPGYLVVSAKITDKDAGGALQSKLTAAEAFLDPATANPAGGTGLHMVAVDGAFDSVTEAAYGLIPISQVKPLSNGEHKVSVRGRDAAGNWGVLFAVSLLVDKIAPVLGTMTGSPNPTKGAANLTLSAPLTENDSLGAAEYWVGTVDPGVGKGISVPIATVGGAATVSVSLAGMKLGATRFNLRVQDRAGNWSNAVNTSVTVSAGAPNAIFTGLFEGTSPGWSAASGSAVTSTVAKMPSQFEPNSAKGLLTTVATTGTNRTAFVTDNSPSAETSYHAAFQFNANTLNTGTGTWANNWVTIFDGQTNANTTVFQLQVRRAAATGSVQYRIVSRNQAPSPVFTLAAAGAHALRIDWSASATGTLALSVDGTSRLAVNDNGAGAVRLKTVRLGLVAATVASGNAGAPSGSAWFDGFTSTRFTLP